MNAKKVDGKPNSHNIQTKGPNLEGGRLSKLTQRCFCGNQRPFSQCCQLYIDAVESGQTGTVKGPQVGAPTAEALMRSRYSAFCQGNVDYLVATHHPSMRAEDAAQAIAQTVRQTQWTHLMIISKQKGQKKDKRGFVEFVAVYRARPDVLAIADPAPAPLTQLHERSEFVKEAGRWFYLKGEILPPYRPGRSQPCWCGSAKPFKHCHG